MFKNLSTQALGFSGRQSEIIELALSFGFKGIDLDLAEFREQVQAKGLPHARRLLDSARLKFGGFRLPVVWDEDDETYRSDANQLNALAELAAGVGCTRALTTIAPANDLRPYPENFEFHRRRLNELAEKLAPHKIRVGLEFVAPPALRQGRAYQFIHSFDALATLVKMIRSPHVGVVVDLWQIYAGGNSLDEIRKLTGDQIVAVFVSDAPQGAPPDESARVLPGEGGAIDTSAALTLLAELGYDGPVTPRPHPVRFKGMGREAIVRTASEKLDQAWKAAGLSQAGKPIAPVAKK